MNEETATALQQSERLLIRLHDLIARDEDESEDGELIRRQLDSLWQQLSAAERRRIDGLAADLYALHGHEASPAAATSADEGLAIGAARAWHHHEWERFLEILREDPPVPFDQGYLAFSRARAYEELGHLEVALWFMDQAVAYNPKPSYRYLALEIVKRLGWIEEAVRRADEYLAEPEVHPALTVGAAGALFTSTQQMNDHDATAIYRRIQTILEKALVRGGATDTSVRVSGFVLLGLAYESLGEMDQAEQAYRHALNLDPQSDVALLARANLAKQAQPSCTVGPGEADRRRRYRFELAESLRPDLLAA